MIFIGIGITGKGVFLVEQILLNRMVISWIDGEADHKGLQDCLGHIPPYMMMVVAAGRDIMKYPQCMTKNLPWICMIVYNHTVTLTSTSGIITPKGVPEGMHTAKHWC